MPRAANILLWSLLFTLNTWAIQQGDKKGFKQRGGILTGSLWQQMENEMLKGGMLWKECKENTSQRENRLDENWYVSLLGQWESGWKQVNGWRGVKEVSVELGDSLDVGSNVKKTVKNDS